jgi:hypothetical protein
MAIFQPLGIAALLKRQAQNFKAQGRHGEWVVAITRCENLVWLDTFKEGFHLNYIGVGHDESAVAAILVKREVEKF